METAYEYEFKQLRKRQKAERENFKKHEKTSVIYEWGED